MITIVGFAGAAAVGALVRWRVSIHRLPRPAATILVNVAGSLALGLVHGWTGPALTVIGVGGLGTLTTFSTLSDDIAQLWRSDRRLAVTYVGVTLVGGVGAASIGLAVSG